MQQNKNDISLIQSILSIIFSMIIWIVFIIVVNIPMDHVSEVALILIITVAFLLSIPGAIMAIFAKKNNILEKQNVIYISALGIIISAVDIFFLISVMPMAILSSLKINIISLNYVAVSFSVALTVAIIIIVTYYRAKPIHKV